MKRIVTFAIILGVIGLVAFRLISNKKVIDSKNIIQNESGVKVAVNVAKAEKRLNEKNLNLVGTVTANQVIEIKSEVSGKLTSINFKLGDYVKKGQVIGRIDNTIRALSLDNAQEKLADARQNFERYKNLFEGGAATQAQLDQYKLAYETAQNQLAQARKELSNTAITAPISGFISDKFIENGAFVNIASPIATIVDISELKVKLSVPEKDVYALKTGDVVKVSSSVLPGENFEGKITFISPRGDDAHNYPVEISLKNNSKNQLKAGTYVDIAFNRKSTVPSIQIPREAISGSVKNASVYVVENNKAVSRKIVIGNDNGAWLEVLDGLKEGEVVVTSGQINLTENSEVSIIQ